MSTSLHSLSREELIGVIEGLIGQIKKLKAERDGRPTPDRAGNKPKSSGKAGRKAGQGTFPHRPAPKPASVIETIEVPLESVLCPDCGTVLEVKVEDASITDLPQAPKPVVKRFLREIGVWLGCGKTVSASHPELGATAHRVGAGVDALGSTLHYYCGLPLPKELSARPLIHANDTGWRQRGKAVYLRGFFAHDLAVYQVRGLHRNEEVREAIGENYQGTSYNATALAGVDQQKCLPYLVCNLAEVEETKTARARKFSRELRLHLLGSMKLWNLRRDKQIDPYDYREECCEWKDELKRQLRPRRLCDADNHRLLDGIGHQWDLGNLTRFIDDPLVEPTNNLAERLLRPAVIALKVSQSTKNDRGYHAFEVHKSIEVTWQLRELRCSIFSGSSTTALSDHQGSPTNQLQ